DLHDPVAFFQLGRVGRAAGEDVADFLARLGVVTQGQHAQPGVRVRGQRAGQLDVLDLDGFVAALNGDVDTVAVVLAAELVQDLGVVVDRLAIHLGDGVARLDAVPARGRLGGHRGDGRGRTVLVAALHGDAEQAAAEVPAFLEPREGGVNV